MKIRFLFCSVCLATTAVLSLNAAKVSRGFAIVVDSKSYSEARAEVDNYARAIEEVNRLKVYLVQDRWGVPDSIRAELKRLYSLKKQPIEGCVLLGDIPVAMIRDAQHLTSAFKMNQKADPRQSSVPSDRFYDDFSLSFKFLNRDSVKPYYYYSLEANSPQRLSPAIYSGRVRPSDSEGVSKYEKLRIFLRKAVEEKRHPRHLDQMLYFSGHGYVSGSITARIDEKQGLYEHFPWLHRQRNGIGYISHDQQNVTKYLLMNELQRHDLDFAILHHHGAPEMQYMDGLPPVNTARDAKKFLQAYLRAHLHHAVDDQHKDRDSITAKLLKFLDVSPSWLADAYDKDVMKQDSIDDADEDLHVADFKAHGYKPNCRVVMIDACFTGSFHLDSYIAGEYIFGQGKTVAVIANSVNVLQDKWSDRYMGLMGLGARVGFLPRVSEYLESHLIGDPTFSFVSEKEGIDVNELLASEGSSQWKKYLKETQYPDLQGYAIERLSLNKAISASQLLDIFRTSPFALVRVEALVALARYGGDEFIEAIKLGVNDSYELVQRFSLNYLAQSGDNRLIPALISVAVSNNTSKRCNFSAMNALSMFEDSQLQSEFKRQFAKEEVDYMDKEKVGKSISRAIHSASDKWVEEIGIACNPDSTMKKRNFAIRATRNYTPGWAIPQLIQLAEKDADVQVRISVWESLGWRVYSCYVPQIAAAALRASKTDKDANVRNEALKTYNRVTFNGSRSWAVVDK